MPNSLINNKMYELNCPECMKHPLVKKARIQCFLDIKWFVEASEEMERQLTEGNKN